MKAVGNAFLQHTITVNFKIKVCRQALKFVKCTYIFGVVAVNINVLITNNLLPTC